MFFRRGSVPLCDYSTYRRSKRMQEVKIPGVIIKSEMFPQHNCKEHLHITEETHSYVNSRNVIIGRYFRCKICSKIFEEYDPKGLDI